MIWTWLQETHVLLMLKTPSDGMGVTTALARPCHSQSHFVLSLTVTFSLVVFRCREVGTGQLSKRARKHSFCGIFCL